MQTGSMERAVLNGTTADMLHVNYYDSHGQPLCVVRDNHLGGRTNRFFKYNFSGQITEETTLHYSAHQDTVVVRRRHTYDHVGRELLEYFRLNDNPEFMSRAYEYNGIGDLLNTYLYSQDNGNTFAQKLKYHYNIRGWLTDVNSFSNPGYDLFALKLAYEAPNTVLGDEARYNGNISQMCSNGRYSMPFGFGYFYDEYDRLFSTNYAEGVGLGLNVDACQEDYDYDDNGNLTLLSRKQNGHTLDLLWFTYYEGTNRISQIDDVSEERLGYPCVSGTYLYDFNGNTIHDPSKFIDVTYNRFNQPLTITSAVSEQIKYTYSTTGAKLRKEYSALATPGSRIIDYCDEFLYEDNELVCIFTPFGRITPMETPFGIQWRTSYSLTDHLGNVRAEFVAYDGGQVELLQQTDYYPFGYTMRRNDYASTRPNHHLYGGKELQDETVAGRPLGWYDFEARMYDPLIGRFLSTDPLAEKYYGLTPYGYCGNNPMNAYDLHGDSISILYNNNMSVMYYEGNLYNKDGTAFEGKNYFLTQCLDAIREIRNSSVGDNMVSSLQSSSNMFTISEGDNDYKPLVSDWIKAYANQIKTDPENSYLLEKESLLEGGAGGNVIWNHYGTELPTTEGISVNGHMDLAHELSHAFDSDRGLLDDRKEQGVSRTEWQAVQKENMIRSQLGHPLRTHYKIATDPQGKRVSGIGPRMLTDDNKPLSLPW